MARKIMSLSRKLVMAMVLTSTIATTISSPIQLIFEYRSANEELDSSLTVFASSTIESFRNLVWTFNEDALKQQVQAALQPKEYVSVTIYNDANEVLAGLRKEQTFKSITNTSFDLIAEDDATKKIGRVELAFTKDFIIEHMYERAIQIVATNFAKTVMVSFILMLVIANIVVRPLQHLEKSVSGESFGKDRGQAIQLPKRFFGNPSDELNVLADRLEDSRQKLLKQLEEVQGEKNRVQSELDVERERAQKNQRLVEMAVLAAGIGHEILNPVTIISSHTRKVRKLIEAKKMTLNDLNNAIAGVDKGLARITGIISGMKSLVRDGSNDPFKSVSIANIFDDVRSIVDNSIGKHGVDVTLADGTDGCHIRCRAVQMSQVIAGLVTNARDAIEALPEKWIRVESRIEGQNVIITITDSGKGIPPEVVQRLFVPFFTTKEPGKGTGLGLSIAKGVMDQHQGSIEVNQQSPNTQFVLRVPMAIQDKVAS